MTPYLFNLMNGSYRTTVSVRDELVVLILMKKDRPIKRGSLSYGPDKGVNGKLTYCDHTYGQGR